MRAVIDREQEDRENEEETWAAKEEQIKEDMNREEERNSSPRSDYNGLLYLSADQIDISDEINVRPFNRISNVVTDQDQAELDRLVKSIEENGQEQPIVVMPSGEVVNGVEKYTLVAGNRRLQAISIINAGREENNLLPIMAVVSNASDPFRAAYDENDKRQDMSPMNKCMNFKTVRERNKWKGAKGDKLVAEYFGVNIATVTQYKKLENLPSDIQLKTHDGTLSMDAALVVAKTDDPHQQQQIVADAERIEAEKKQRAAEIEAEVEVSTGGGKKTNGKKKTSATVTKTKTRQAKGGKSGVSASSVKEAARGHNIKIARNRKTILEFWESENGPAYKEPVREFITYMLKWADGDGTDKTLREKFKTIVGKAGLSTQEEVKSAGGVTKTNANSKSGGGKSASKSANKK